MNLDKYHRKEVEFFIVHTEVGTYDVTTTVEWRITIDGQEVEMERSATIKPPQVSAHMIREESTFPPRILKLIDEDVQKRIAKKVKVTK